MIETEETQEEIEVEEVANEVWLISEPDSSTIVEIIDDEIEVTVYPN